MRGTEIAQRRVEEVEHARAGLAAKVVSPADHNADLEWVRSWGKAQRSTPAAALCRKACPSFIATPKKCTFERDT